MEWITNYKRKRTKQGKTNRGKELKGRRKKLSQYNTGN